MAVQIPKIQRIAPQGPASVGRMDVSTPDLVSPQGQVTKAIGGFADATIEAYDRAEKDAINTETYSRTNKLQAWAKERLEGKNGLKYREDDPTEHFRKFDEELEQKYKELSIEGDLSPRARRAIEKSLAETRNSIIMQSSTLEGYQYDKYRERVKTESLGLEKLNAVDALSFANPADPASFVPFEARLGKIRDIHLKDALSKGFANESPNGKILLIDEDGNKKKIDVNDPGVIQNLEKDLGETVYTTVDNALNARNTSLAKATFDKYKAYLNATLEGKLVEKFKKADTDDEAYQVAAQVEEALVQAENEAAKNNTKVDRITVINGVLNALPKDKAKVKHKARQLIDETHRYQTNEMNRVSQQAYLLGFNIIDKRRQDGDPFQSLAELDADPEMKIIFQTINNPTQLKALQQMVVAPEISDPDAILKIDKMLQDGDFLNLDSAELHKSLAGLNQRDRRIYKNYWDREKVETTPEERSRGSLISTVFDEYYGLSGLVLKDNNVETDYSKEQRAKRKTEFLDLFTKAAPNISRAEIIKIANEMIARWKVEEKNENKPWWKNLPIFGSSDEPVPEKPTVREGGKRPRGSGGGTEKKEKKKSFEEMSDGEVLQIMNLYKKETKQKHKDIKQLKEWWDKR